MVNTLKLKGKMRECNITQAVLDEKLGMTARTMNSRLKCGIFKTNEIDEIAVILNLTQDEIMEIFLASKALYQETL